MAKKSKSSKRKGPKFEPVVGEASLTRRKVIRRHITAGLTMVVGTKTITQYGNHTVAKGKHSGELRTVAKTITVDRTTPNPRNRNARINGATVGDAWKLARKG